MRIVDGEGGGEGEGDGHLFWIMLLVGGRQLENVLPAALNEHGDCTVFQFVSGKVSVTK